jgi:probable HAF family extracellular repeat protein
VVVGKSKNTDPNNLLKSVKEAFRWVDGVMTGLGFLHDDTKKVESEAKAASYDGSTVVGTSNVDDPNNDKKSVKQAFIWSDDVMTPLGFLGEDDGVYESKATGVSADGSVVVGESKTVDGKEAFVTNIPEPVGGLYAGIAMLIWLNRRRSARDSRRAAA